MQLLNAGLREDIWWQGVRYHGDQEVYAFMGRPDEPPRRLKYANLKLRSTTTVVSHYEHKPKSGKPTSTCAMPHSKAAFGGWATNGIWRLRRLIGLPAMVRTWIDTMRVYSRASSALSETGRYGVNC